MPVKLYLGIMFNTLCIATVIWMFVCGAAMPPRKTWRNACLTQYKIEGPRRAFLHGTEKEVDLITAPDLDYSQLFAIGYCIDSTPSVTFNADGSICRTVTQRHQALVFMRKNEVSSTRFCKNTTDVDWLVCWEWVDLPGPCQMMVLAKN